MMREILAATVGLVALPISTYAQGSRLTFDQAAYISCRDAQVMQSEARKQVAVFLAEHVAVIDRAFLAETERLPKR